MNDTNKADAAPAKAGSKRTPTPWRMDGDLIRGADDTLIAKVTPLDCGEGRDNAALLLSAPALLATLEDAREVLAVSLAWPNSAKIRARINAAIAKAKGEA